MLKSGFAFEFQKTLSHFKLIYEESKGREQYSKLNLLLHVCDLICVLIKKFLLNIFDHYLNYS